MCGSIPPLIYKSPFAMWCLIKHKDTFTFTVPFHFHDKELDPILSEPVHNELHYIEMPLTLYLVFKLCLFCIVHG